MSRITSPFSVLLLLLATALPGLRCSGGPTPAAPADGVKAGPVDRSPYEAADLALAWLAGRQDADGSWSRDGDPIADTGLALLAFLSAGETHKHGSYREIVKSGLRFLESVQAPDGRFGSPAEPGGRERHAIATLAMAEEYALTATPRFKRSAQAAIDVLVTFDLDDASRIPWDAAAVHAAREGGLRLPPDAATRSLAAALMGRLPPETEILVRTSAGESPPGGEAIRAATEHLLRNPPEWGVTPPIRVWLGTRALVPVGGEALRTWYAALEHALLSHQIAGGEDRGAWPPARVRATALYTMALIAWYRFPTRVLSPDLIGR